MRRHHLQFVAVLAILASIGIGACLLTGCGDARGETTSDRVLIVLVTSRSQYMAIEIIEHFESSTIQIRN
jgi:hypothetical protein